MYVYWCRALWVVFKQDFKADSSLCGSRKSKNIVSLALFGMAPCSVGHESAQVQFAAYKQFCDDTTVEKQRAIKEANAKMEQLSAAIQKVTALW